MQKVFKNFSIGKYRELASSFLDHQRFFFRNLSDDSQLHHRLMLPVDQLYELVHRDSQPVFVLSTGRTGTKLLSKLLSKDKSYHIAHKPYPELTYHAGFAHRHYRDRSDIISAIVDAARYEVIRDCYILKRTYVETNNRITFFCHQLASLFPQSKFIHLEREVLPFVSSGYSRNWYANEKMFDEGRIIPHQDEGFPWNDWSQCEKITWLWWETNQFIKSFFAELGQPGRCFHLSSEALYTSTEQTAKLLEFMGSKSINLPLIEKAQRTPVNAQPGRKRKSLTVKQKESVEHLIAHLSSL